MTGDDAGLRRAYRIAYDGREFHGFQRQPDVPTVSDAILTALRALDVVDSGAVPSGYAAAGRTDAGVSAAAQTVAFDAPAWLTPAALNAELPADVRAWAAADVSADFHATHDASAREYTYFLYAPDADVTRAREALDRLSGRHDFHNLTPDETGTVRDLTGTVVAEDDFLVVTVRAGGFPRQLVRRLITVLERVATGTTDRTLVDAVLGEAPLSGPEGVPPAPPEPLVLSAVDYPDVAFEADDDAVSSVRDVFRSRRREALVAARVYDALGRPR